MGTFLTLFGSTLALGMAIRAVSSRESRSGGGKGKLTRRFDPIFRVECAGSGVPIAYMRALAKKESNFDPDDTQGPAHGLMQITEVLRRDFNKRKGTSISRADLLNPHINVRIACDLLGRIASLYVANHPQAFPGGVDWNDRRFVELVTFGWNAGFSERSGVGAMIGALERKGLVASQITAAAVHQEALQNDRAVRFLRIPRRLNFSQSVTDLYLRTRKGVV